MIMHTLIPLTTDMEIENSAIINNSTTDNSAAQRNNPAPPAISHEMIGGPYPTGATRVGHLRKFFAPFVAIPFFHAGKTRPHGVDRMIEIRAKMPELARNHGGASARVHDPTCANRALLLLKIESDNLLAAVVQFQRRDFGGPH